MKIRGQEILKPKDRIEALSIPVTESGCWIWLGGTDGNKLRNQYGKICIGSRTNNTRRSVNAHRYSYETYKGAIPKGMFVCHSCDISLCVNPNHLWLGTRQDNTDDREKKNRNNPPKGENHPFSTITNAQAAEIKWRRLKGEKIKEISKDMGISINIIKDISKGRNWKEIKPKPPNDELNDYFKHPEKY